jgi:hypothetical protein
MLSKFITAAVFSAALLPTAALAGAHPEPKPAVKAQAAKPDARSTKAPTKLEDIKLPTQAEINDMVNSLPDMNAVMGQMMTVMKDPDIRANMEKSGKAFAKRMESSGALKTSGPDDLPDFNKAFEAMLGMMGDQEAMGGLLSSMGAMAEGLEGIEKHLPEPTVKSPATK